MARKKPKSPPPTADYVVALWNLKITDGDEFRLRALSRMFRLLCRMELPGMG